MRRLLPLLLLAACARAPAPSPADRQIRLAGAAAGLPFAADAAERYARSDARAIAPLARAGGNAAGIAAFCGGAGPEHPDLVIATRPMTAAERGDCARHGVRDVAAIPFGWTALVAATRADGPPLAPGLDDLRRAFAGDAGRWGDVDTRLPAVALAPAGLDGPPRPGGERFGADAARVARAAAATPGSVALLPYAQAAAARPALRLLAVDGVVPDAATIADGRYPLARPLVLIAKGGVRGVPGLPALLGIVARSIGPDGPFAARGLVPLPPAGRAAARLRLERAAKL